MIKADLFANYYLLMISNHGLLLIYSSYPWCSMLPKPEKIKHWLTFLPVSEDRTEIKKCLQNGGPATNALVEA